VGYHILCDEHVEPETVDLLEDDGHDAVHVQGVLELGVDDSALSEWAREHGYAILTNDRGFLKEKDHPGVTVLCYTDNRASAYELAEMVEELEAYFPTHDDLPDQCFLR